ncbi:NUDIX hydrolase [Corynebacterium callunae]|uniref:Phosphatase n=1 Tax=Corynebacterium callunae DSM 20147 TaxID=1121353 RepID=M1UYD9_9CORY|nr:NUDIX domain-containing protein [Corynebacterium callunae]AGG66473.1 phosphatase [Corynebacterium callunae DSM 20147]
MSQTKDIRIAAVIFHNVKGEILSVRKAGTSSFMMPGGKLEGEESPLAAAIREIAEELHLELAESELEHLGRFAAPAANEVGFNVDCDVFVCSTALTELPEVYEEIAEARFFPAHSQSAELAPLSRDVVFPQL